MTIGNVAAQEVLSRSIRDGVSLLAEDEGKSLLARFGIGVPDGRRVPGLAEAESVAEELGYPLVVKALVPGLAHKTDRGAVKLGIRDKADLQNAVHELQQLFPDAPLLVEQMARPGVELIAGLTNDERVGPCLMIGVGGILTEIFQDVQFLLLPATRADIHAALDRLRGSRLLGGFRGAVAVDIQRVVDVLQGLAQFGLEAAEYYEAVDINPLMVNDGGAMALDVKVMLKPTATPPMASPRSLGARHFAGFFAPRSVAIVGASSGKGKPGNVVIENILANGYAGQLHLVNPKGGEILGMPVYPTVGDLPEGIDLAVIIVPARDTPGALRDVAARGIKHVVLSAGGFAETDEIGAQIQEELIATIAEGGIHVLGPNTSGHISTPHNFTSTFFPLGKIRRGHVAYVAQTGNFATFTMKYILTAERFGVSRVVGLGNKIDIEESQALEYLGGDPETRAIVMYVESIKYPRRFVDVAREVTRRKPVVMLKGGSTEAGKKAAAAHTAALASEDRLVDGMLRQGGIVRVSEYSHLVLAGKALSMSPLPAGNRVAFLAPSGAMLVCLSDLSTRLGLMVPELEGQTLRRIQEITPPFIRIRNPVDIWAAALSVGIEAAYGVGMEAVLEDPNVDAVIPIFMLTRETGIPESYEFIVDLAGRHPAKPVLVSFTGDKRCMDECRESLEPRGVPTFMQIEEPFQALSILSRCAEVARRAER
ncbi:MAG: acetate--CoA ligase family protein [bacterium]